jgi:hypothetical protein
MNKSPSNEAEEPGATSASESLIPYVTFTPRASADGTWYVEVMAPHQPIS